MDTKACSKCKEVKPLSAFHRDSTKKSGRRSRCARCGTDDVIAYHKRNPERHRMYAKAYRAANRAEVLEKKKEYNEKPETKERNREYYRKRSLGSLTAEEWEGVLEHFGHRCAYCGDEWGHIEHFYPLSKGGEHEIHNVVPSCAPCNLSKRADDPYEWYVDRFGTELPESARPIQNLN